MTGKLYNVYFVQPQYEGSVKHELAAQFIESPEEIHVLEDDAGVLGGIQEGAITERTRGILANLRRASYFAVVLADDIASATSGGRQ